MRQLLLDLRHRLLQVKERTPTAWTADELGVGHLDTHRLQDTIEQG